MEKERDLKAKMIWEETGENCGIFIPDFVTGIDILEKKIRDSGHKYKYITGIPRGGLVVAVTLSHRLGLEYMSFNTWIQMLISRKIKNGDVLLCDDIADTGLTLEIYDKKHIAVLIWKSKNCSFEPRFYAFDWEGKEWMVFPWEE